MNNQKVICVFQRDEQESDKGELIVIFDKPENALDFIEKSNIPNLFWEQWFIQTTSLTDGEGKK